MKKKNIAHVILYRDEVPCDDVWQEYCDVAGVYAGYDCIKLVIDRSLSVGFGECDDDE